FLIMGLRWLSLGFGARLPTLVHTGVSLLAFVAFPPLLMAVMLSTRPREALGLRLPPPQELLLAVLLAPVVLPPLAQLTFYILDQFPILKELINEHEAIVEVFRGVGAGGPALWQYLLIVVVLPAVSEELAFRGFILRGLRRRFRPWTAILLSSFLF